MACVVVVGLLTVEWGAAPSLPVPPEDAKIKSAEPFKVTPPGKPSAEHLEKLRDKLKELNPNMEGRLPVRFLPWSFVCFHNCCRRCRCLSALLTIGRSLSAGEAGVVPCQT